MYSVLYDNIKVSTVRHFAIQYHLYHGVNPFDNSECISPFNKQEFLEAVENSYRSTFNCWFLIGCISKKTDISVMLFYH